MKRAAQPGRRARDPGVKRGQVGRVTWAHCPECDGPAKLDSNGATCIRCGYITVQNRDPYRNKWARIRQDNPLCVHCRNPLPTEAVPSSREIDGELHVRVRCPHCGETEGYRAMIWFPPRNHPVKETVWLPLYLQARVGGHMLVVDNLAHLDMLEDYLGADLRERGPVAGLTMMARLPAWMKSATMRPKILRALRQLRERAEKAGIDE